MRYLQRGTVRGGMSIKFGLTLGIGAAIAVGAAAFFASTTSSHAQAAASCNGGNRTLFTTLAPAGGAANVNLPVTLMAGDVLTLNVGGQVLSVAIDLNPGSILLFFANGAGGTRATTVGSSGNFTINGALNANGGGQATLEILCTPAPGNAQAPGELTPEDVAGATDNADETNRVVEEFTFDELFEEAMREEYERQFEGLDGPPQPEPLTTEERNAAKKEQADIRQELADIEKKLEPLESQIESIQGTIDYLLSGDREEKKNNAEAMAELFTPVDIDAQNKRQRQERAGELSGEKAVLEGKATPLRTRENELLVRYRELSARLSEGQEPETDLELRPFVAEAYGDPYMREFNEIVSYFDQQQPDSFRPVAFNAALDRKTVAWIRASYTDFSQNDGSRLEGDTIMIGAGVHREFWEDLRLGLLFSTAWSDNKSSVNNLDVDSRSYSAGVYARYFIDGLDLSARARYGWSDSDIQVGGASGSYDSQRVNVALSATGQESINPVVWVRHTTGLSTTWSERDSYTNSANVRVGSTDVWGGRVSLGPTIGMTLDKTELFDVIEPSLGFSGAYVFSDRDSQAGQVATSEDDYLTFAVSPALRIATHEGASFSVNAQYFGIAADLQGWTFGGTVSIPLN